MVWSDAVGEAEGEGGYHLQDPKKRHHGQRRGSEGL